MRKRASRRRTCLARGSLSPRGRHTERSSLARSGCAWPEALMQPQSTNGNERTKRERERLSHSLLSRCAPGDGGRSQRHTPAAPGEEKTLRPPASVADGATLRSVGVSTKTTLYRRFGAAPGLKSNLYFVCEMYGAGCCQICFIFPSTSKDIIYHELINIPSLHQNLLMYCKYAFLINKKTNVTIRNHLLV
jgi:hypothetical protein